jgi:carbonic anhydrase
MMDIIYRILPEFRSERLAPASSEEARQRLEEGNRVFASSLTKAGEQRAVEPSVIPFSLNALGVGEDTGSAPVQAPFALVLGCSDARVPTELVFSQACNDLFVVRVAGNVLGNECLGSIDYALDHMRDSLKLLVVLGHNGCGAVTAAVDTFLKPSDYLAMATSYALRSVVDRIFLAARAAVSALEAVWGPGVAQRPGYRRACIETTVVFNAALAAYTLQREVSESAGTCGVVYGVYDLVTHRVGLPAAAADDAVRLVAPPLDRADFAQFAHDLVAGDAVRGWLQNPATRSMVQ